MPDYPAGFEPIAAPNSYPPGFEPVTASPRDSEALSIPTVGEAYSRMAKPVTDAVAWAARRTPMATLAQALMGTPEDTMARGAHTMAEAVVPQTPAGAGAALGSLAMGPLGPLARILGAGAGGGVGSAATGNDLGTVAKDAGFSAGGAAVGEGASAVGSKLIRSLPWMKGVIAEGDAAGYGARMGEQSPPLAGAQTTQELRTLAAGPGRDALGAAKEQALQAIEQRISTGPVLPMPSLGGTGMSLRQANDALSEIGARAFSKNPLDRTFNGIDQRRLYGQVAQDIEAGLGSLDPHALALFQDAQGVYARGTTLLKPLQQASGFRMDATGAQFNTPEIQRLIGSPKGEAMLRNKLGDAGFEELRDTMLRGGAPGEVDRLAGGAAGPFDALLKLLRQGGGFGTTAVLPFQMALPNVGSRYAGTPPFTAPTGLQSLMDLIGSQGAVKIGDTYGR